MSTFIKLLSYTEGLGQRCGFAACLAVTRLRSGECTLSLMVRSAAMLPQSALKAAVGASAAIFLIFLVTVGNVDRGEPAGVLLEERYLYGAHGKRWRSPAPGVKAMEERFETFYQKGLRGGEETRIDLPVQHFSVTSSGVHAAGSVPVSTRKSLVCRELFALFLWCFLLDRACCRAGSAHSEVTQRLSS